MKNDFKNIYFIGVGGIGMSNLARYFNVKGKNVAGYDRTESLITKGLSEEGISIHFDDDISLVPDIFLDKKSTLIVRTPAVPETHSELAYFTGKGFRVLKRSQVLGYISQSCRALCVAGTHGKTTTSILTSHILKQSVKDCNAFLGGISKNYNTNLLLSDKSDLTVMEADEYDRSFHYLSPYMAVVTSTDADHLDIYGSYESYLESFAKFTSLVRSGGSLIVKKGITLDCLAADGVKIYSYSSGEEADFYAKNIRIGNGSVIFDCCLPDHDIRDIVLGVPVRVNIENSVAAIAVAYLNGVSDGEIKNAVASFKGIWRRFDIHVKRDDFVYIDDYAHHPKELKASIGSIKELYPDKKVTGIFQPHLYTRTRDFANEFAEALSGLDELILLDIYPAREQPIKGVTSKLIYDKVSLKNKTISSFEKIFDILDRKKPEVLVTLGAGNIDSLVPEIERRYGK